MATLPKIQTDLFATGIAPAGQVPTGAKEGLQTLLATLLLRVIQTRSVIPPLKEVSDDQDHG